MPSLLDSLRNFLLKRPLLPEEELILDAVREKYPAHPKDRLFFIKEQSPLLPVRSSAMIMVWGVDGSGPWVHITNLAGFMKGGMSLAEIKATQL